MKSSRLPWYVLFLALLVSSAALRAVVNQSYDAVYVGVQYEYTETALTNWPGGSLTVTSSMYEDQQYVAYTGSTPAPIKGYQAPTLRILDSSRNVVASVPYVMSNPGTTMDSYTWLGTYSATIASLPAGNYTISVKSGYRGGLVAGDGYFLNRIDAAPADFSGPVWVKLFVTPSIPSASISVSPSSIIQGSTTNLTLGRSGTAASGHVLTGPSGYSASDPSSPVRVTPPTVGTDTYTYVVQGTVMLNWNAYDMTGTFTLTLPSGSTVDVTSLMSYPATAPGTYKITQTNLQGSSSDTQVVTIPTASASTNVTVTSPLAINSYASVLNTSTPSVTIMASPVSGNSPLTTTVSWTTVNASSFSVTKNGSAWANSGSNRVEAGLTTGSYTYQITAQPQAYSATLSWSATGAASYRITGPGYDSGWMTSTSVTVPTQGTYTLTAATGVGGAGATATAQVSTQVAPGAVVAMTTVQVLKGLQTVTLSPTAISVAPGASVGFSAQGGHTVYLWGGQASGAGSSKSFSAPLMEGDYEVTVQDPGNGDWAVSNLATATLSVRKLAQPSLNLQASTPQIYASTQTLSVSGGATGGAVSYSIVGQSLPGVASLDGAQLRANSGKGWVDVQASMVGNGTYEAVLSPVVRVMLAKAPQRVTLSPSLTGVQPGGSFDFEASGGSTAYAWGGLASGAGALKTVTAPLMVGDYRVSVQAVEDDNFQASPIEQATLRVDSPVQVQLQPLASEKLIQDASSPLDGRRFPRLWQVGGAWCAYLGRDGLQFQVDGRASKELGYLELQGRSSAEGAEWTLLASGAPLDKYSEGGQQVGTRVFVLRLGEVAADNPLVPVSFQQGRPLIGLWHFRARAQDAEGRWSDWSAEVPVQVQLPLLARSEQVQTLPPAGAQGAWFKASEPKTFEFQVWIP